MSDFEHISVLPNEVIDALNIKPGGIYVDGTLGGGGHSSLIMQELTTGKLIGIDRDQSAINAATEKIRKQNAEKNFVAVRGNFHELPNILDELGYKEGTISGILLDLGVSSHQIDTAERGFSFRNDGPLDMRMDKDSALSARDVINTYTENELIKIFFEYGEERYSKKIARRICAERDISPIETTLRLAEIIEKSVGAVSRKGVPHPAMRTFMALRIAVNDELSPLADALRCGVRFLTKGGRIAVISFHSLEDRIVKTTFAKLASPCECPRDIPYCSCGKVADLRVVTRKPITPSDDELLANSRAHSAKLRCAEKI